MSGPHGRSNSKSRFASSVNGNHSDQTPQVKAGVNPLYGSEIKAGSGIQSLDASGTEDEGTASTRPEGTRGQGPSSRTIIISSRGSSPLSSTMTTSTAQSAATSNAGRHLSSGKVTNITRVSGGSGSTCSITSRSGAMDEKVSRSESTRTEPPVLVPALMAPVPPPPRKRRLEKAPDVECGEVEAEVVQEAPDKTLMEMLQSYLNKQDVYTRVMLVMILMVLAGGVFGAYGVLLVYAIRDHNLKYIVLCSLFTAVFLSVLWKVSRVKHLPTECIYFLHFACHLDTPFPCTYVEYPQINRLSAFLVKHVMFILLVTVAYNRHLSLSKYPPDIDSVLRLGKMMFRLTSVESKVNQVVKACVFCCHVS